MMYHNNKLCISAGELIQTGIITKTNFDKLKQRGKINVISRACYGNPALVEFDTLPEKIKQAANQMIVAPQKKQATYLESFFVQDMKAFHFYNNYRLQDGSGLSKEKIQEYTTNASVLNALIDGIRERTARRKAAQNSIQGTFSSFLNDVEAIREITGHTLKVASLRKKLAQYKKESYQCLISGNLGNNNTAKIKAVEQNAMLEELIKKHNNFDNEQIKEIYNLAAKAIGWKKISATTVARYRAKTDIYTYAGRRGSKELHNNKLMHVKRAAPEAAMVYWTMDGWDAELLFQQKNKKNATTFHNRLTVVIVLDPSVKYPVGYAVGTHESPELIKEALRNAIVHTKELFGKHYQPLQLQTDRYGKGKLTPLYEALSQTYTPARVGNAKAKVIEPYFLRLNKMCQLMPNWSGFGITSHKESQPNAEYLNKIRHQFPDMQGCRAQIEHLIMIEREEKREAYIEAWSHLPEADRLPLDATMYLDLFGETTGFTNRLQHDGFNPTIRGERLSFDCFDTKFRELAHLDWVVKYDPADLSQVLVVNVEKKHGQIKEIGTHKFILEQRYIQPMALYDRKEGDGEELARVQNYNKELTEKIIQRGTENNEMIQELFIENPQLSKVLAKIVITDSKGQHKNQRNANRKADLPPPDEKYEIIEENIRYKY